MSLSLFDSEISIWRNLMRKLLLILMLLPFHLVAAPVNINQADAETLSESLNGVGPKKAEAIVKYRAEHGHFETLQDLEKVPGIGEKTIKINEKEIIFTDKAVGDVAEKAKSEQVDKKSK